MNTLVMNKAQCLDAQGATAAREPRLSARRVAAPRVRRSKAIVRQLVRRLSAAIAVAAVLAVLVAAIAVTSGAVEALSVPSVTATVELPRIVIRAQRLPAGSCPVPTEPGAACPLPSSLND